MSDLEERASELFAGARSWNPVDRKMLARVAERLESRPSRVLPFAPIAAALALGALILFAIAPKPVAPVELAAPPPPVPAKFETKKLVAPQQIVISAPKSRLKPEPVTVDPLVLERPTAELDIEPEIRTELPAPPKRYVPRAIADLREEESDEVRAYIQWIIIKGDRRALLAAESAP